MAMSPLILEIVARFYKDAVNVKVTLCKFLQLDETIFSAGFIMHACVNYNMQQLNKQKQRSQGLPNIF